MAIYGVAATHDHFAMSRARVEAVSLLTNRGIERAQIMAGVDFDGWTQLVQQGHIGGDGNIKYAGAYARPTSPPDIECQKWFYNSIPAIYMRYAVVTSKQAALKDTRLGPVKYQAWLPPFRRYVWIQRLPESPEPLPVAPPGK